MNNTPTSNSTPPLLRKYAVAAAALFGLFLASPAFAQLYWDTNGATAGAGVTANGTWDTSTSANWTTDSTGSSATTTYTAASDVVFSAGSDTATANITISGSQAANAVTIASGSYTFSGSTLTVGASNFTVSSGASATFNNSITNASSMTFDVDGTLVINAHGGKALTFEGSGNSTISYLDASATVNGGTLTVTGGGKGKGVTVNTGGTFVLAGGAMGNGAGVTVNSGGLFQVADGITTGGVGSLTGTGGTLTGGTGSSLQIGTGNKTSTFNGAITGSVALVQSGTGTFTFSGTSTSTGNITVSTGAFTLGTTGSLTFTIGTNGVNNSVSGVGAANFNGTFNFDLTSADMTGGNSWTIADVTTQSFAGTFAVNGFTDASGIWTNGSGFSFDQSTGLLTFSAIPEPSTYGLLGGLLALVAVIGYRRKIRRTTVPTIA